MADDKPIIIIKKKGGHGGHHGGAWKVAYADFVTAMMAFFLVMWLVNSADVTTKQSIASYFRRPGLFSQGSGTPLLIGESGILQDSFAPSKNLVQKNSKLRAKERIKTPPDKSAVDYKREVPQQGGDPNAEGKTTEINIIPGYGGGKDRKFKNQDKTAAEMEKESLEKLAKEIKQKIAGSPELKQLLGLVDVKVDADGLNIEIMDSEKTSMFALGGSEVLPEAQEAFENIGRLLQKVPNKIDIVGHTDAKPYASSNGYSNWELSADRANAARKLLEVGGIPADQIASVVGKADKQLRNQGDPFAATNRRITLRMKFNMSQTTDLSKDPELANKINDMNANPPVAQVPEQPQAHDAKEISAGTDNADAGEDDAIEKQVDPNKPQAATGFKPQKLIQAANEKRTVALPGEETDTKQPAEQPGSSEQPEKAAESKPAPQKTIFGDSPVVMPSDSFFGN